MGGRYALGLSYLNEDFMFQLEGPHLEQAQACQAPLLLNLAACHLKLADYSAAEWNCTQARPGTRPVGFPPRGCQAVWAWCARAQQAR